MLFFSTLLLRSYLKILSYQFRQVVLTFNKFIECIAKFYTKLLYFKFNRGCNKTFTTLQQFSKTVKILSFFQDFEINKYEEYFFFGSPPKGNFNIYDDSVEIINLRIEGF